MTPYLALALALIAVILPDAAHHAAPHAVAALWALALWATRRHRAVLYHQQRWEHRNCHARPTLARRARLAAHRLRTLRIRMTDTPRTAS